MTAAGDHEKWLDQNAAGGPQLGRMSETVYSGLIAAALLGGAVLRAAVISALVPGRPELTGADLEYLRVPTRGIDLIMSLRYTVLGGEERGVVLLEHKRYSPSNFPKLDTYKTRAFRHSRCRHEGAAQRRRKGDAPHRGIAQLDGAVCFDDWRDDFTRGIGVTERLFLDAEGRSANDAFYGLLTHPKSWKTVSYDAFGGALRQSYDQGTHDAALRQGLLPLLQGLYAC